MRQTARPATAKFAAAGHAELVKEVEAEVTKLRR
jgi:hypothetical protein